MANTKPNINNLNQLISADDIKWRFLSAEEHFKKVKMSDKESLKSAALKTFELDTELTDDQIDEIISSAVIKLTFLPEKVRNKIRDAIVDQSVTKIDLQNCQLKATDMFLITELLMLTSITDLDLWKNPIGDDGAEFIAKCKFLKKLDVSFAKITSKGARALSHISSLRWLDVNHNQIGNVGAKAFANNRSLGWLNLSCNCIGTKGAISLAENTHLLGLDLSNNKFSTTGVQAFINKNKTLIDINLVGNTWDESLLNELEKLKTRNKLTFTEEVIPTRLRLLKETCKNAKLFGQAQRSAVIFRDCQLGALPIEIMLKINELIVGEDKDYQDLFLDEVKHEHNLSSIRKTSIAEHGFFLRDSVHSEKLTECLSDIDKLKHTMDMINKKSCILY